MMMMDNNMMPISLLRLIQDYRFGDRIYWTKQFDKVMLELFVPPPRCLFRYKHKKIYRLRFF